MNKYRAQLERERGMQQHLCNNIEQNKNKYKKLEKQIKNIEKALTIVQVVAQQTQEQLRYRISELVSLALAAIWDDPYEFNIEFVLKRGKTEAEIYFTRNGERIDPSYESGYGAVDVASFALRIALWNLQQPKSIPTIILDEPGKFISNDLQPKFGKMIQMISQKLGVQFIICTHNNALIDSADKVFKITHKNNISKCEVL